MKPRPFFFGRLLLPAALISFSVPAHAVDLFKANNTTRINDFASWFTTTGGPTNVTAIGSTDIGVFDSTITGAISTANISANSTIGGFRITNPGGNVTIGVGAAASGTTLTLAQTAGAYAIDMSAATADLTIGSVATGGNLRWASANYGGFTVASGRTLTINSNFTNQGNNKTIDLNGLGNIVFNGAAGGGVAMGFRITGGANVTMNGTGNWGGTSSKEIINGTLNIGNDAALGTVTLNLGGTNANTPTIAASGGARAIANNVTLLATSLGGTPTIAGSNALTINGTVTVSGADRTLTVNNSALTTLGGTVALSENTSNRKLTFAGSGNVTISGVVTNGAATAANLANTGSGTLALSNANSFSGTLTATSGTTRIDNTLAAQNATVSVGAANAVTFGTGITITTFGGLSGAGDLALTNTDTNAVAVSVGNNNANSSYSGGLSGGGSIAKIGTGTLSLTSGSSSYSGGTTVSSGILAYGNTNALGSNTVTLAGGTLRNDIAGGSLTPSVNVTANSTFRLNAATAGVGTLTSSSASVNLTLENNTGSSGTVADFTQSLTGYNGTLSLVAANAGTFRFNGSTGSSSAAFDLGAGVSVNKRTSAATINLGSLSGAATSSLAGASGSGNTSATTYVIGARGDNSDFAGVISNGAGAVSITKTGSGIQTLSGTNTYTGATTINGGTLALGAAGSIDDTSGVSLGTSGTFDVSAKSGGYTVDDLTGSGTVTGALTVSTQLSIGNSPGTVAFSSDLTLGATSLYLYELNGVSNAADLADVAGNLAITGAILDLVQLGTYTAGEKFTLFAYDGSLTGTFSGKSDDTLFTAAGGDWMINYNDTTAGLNGGVGTSYVTVTAVPEPAAALLGGLGMLALLRRRRG